MKKSFKLKQKTLTTYFSKSFSSKGQNLIHQHLLKLKKSPTLAANEYQASQQIKAKKVIKFGFGQSPFPIHDLIVEKHREKSFDKAYSPSSGIAELQDSIALWLKKYNKLDYNPKNILVGPGTKMMLYLIQLAFNGESVVPAPSWVSYHPQAEILNKKCHVPQTKIEDKWFINPTQIDSLYKESQEKKLFILNSPNNPTGQVMKEAQLKQIADSLIKYKERSIVISDEIYSLYNYENIDSYPSLAHHYYDNTIITNGISKWGNAGGYRVGFAAFPDSLSDFVGVLTNLASETFSSASTPAQHAAVTCFTESVNNPNVREYITHCSKILEVTGKYVAQRIRKIGGECLDPEGGFYVFGDFTKLKDSFKTHERIETSGELVRKLSNETGVQVLAGENFCRKDFELNFRLSFVDFDAKLVLEKSKNNKLNEDFIKSYMPNIVEGMNLIEDFIKSKQK